MLTRARHHQAVDEATRELERFRVAWDAGQLPVPIAATHLRSAVIALEELIGLVDVDDVLDRVFSAFCVGK
jgi:tRNA modification GTPase